MTDQQMTNSSKWPQVGMVIVLLLAYWLMISSMARKSATVDESSHIHRGLAYVIEGATQFRLGHPVIGSAIASFGGLLEPDLIFPKEHSAWSEGQWGVAGMIFMWESGQNGLRILFLSRLTGVFFALLLGAVVYRWGRDWLGAWSGLGASILVVLDPNVIAHARLVTNDVSVTLCYVLCIYGFWRWHRQPHPRFIFLSGLGLGLGLALKYTAAVLVPTLGLLALWLAFRRRSLQPIIAAIGVGMVAWLFIWAAFGFDLRPLPGGVFWDDLLWQIQYLGNIPNVYLNGEISNTGWWYYFPLAFFFKAPLSTLLLILLATVFFLFGKGWQQLFINTDWLFCFIPAAIYLLFTQIMALNIGYRYLINAFPFVMLLVIKGLIPQNYPSWHEKRGAIFVGGLIAGTAIASMSIWPNYIPHFNWLAGGQEGGWRILSDSNVDWGQDLVALREWQIETGHELNLSYFGTAYPSTYGLRFEPMPTWVPGAEQQLPNRQTYYPVNPAPGYYAISVTNLHGAVLEERSEYFSYFREKEPIARAGNSIFIYEVSAMGEPAHVAFSGVIPSLVSNELYDHLNTNDVRVRWFDAETSWIWPMPNSPDAGWLFIDQPLDDSRLEYELVDMIEGIYLYRLLDNWNQPTYIDIEGADVGVAMLRGIDQRDVCGEQVKLSTEWRALQETTRALKIFVHGLNEVDEIVGQSDILTVDSRSWYRGDLFRQTHMFTVSDKAVAFRVGLYDATTGERIGEPMVFPSECAANT